MLLSRKKYLAQVITALCLLPTVPVTNALADTASDKEKMMERIVVTHRDLNSKFAMRRLLSA